MRKNINLLSTLVLMLTLSVGLSSCDNNHSGNSGISDDSSPISPSLPISPSTSTEDPIKPSPIREDKKWCDLLFIKLNANDKIKVNVSLSDTLSVVFSFDDNRENIKPTLEVKIDDKISKSNAFLKDNSTYFMAFNDLKLEDLDKTFTAKAYLGDELVGEINMSVLTYINAILNDIDNFALDIYSKMALETLLVSSINYAGIKQKSMGISEDLLVSKNLTSEQRALLYNSSSDNFYNKGFNFVERDNLTTEGQSAEDFSWINGEIDFVNNALVYKFSVKSGQYNSLKARVSFEDDSYDVQVNKIDTTDDKDNYYVSISNITPLQYHEDVKVEIYGDSTLISQKATYSFLRGLGHADNFASAIEKEQSNALYSLAKASIWWNYKNDIVYTKLPAVNDNGIITFDLFKYSFDDARFLLNKQFSTFGSYVYMGNAVCDSNNNELEGDNFSIKYENNEYVITLNGAEIDGILLSGAANVKIIVNADSIISSTLYRNWNDKNNNLSASIINDSGNVTITSNNDAKLTLNGNILINGDLTIDGSVITNVNLKKDINASKAIVGVDVKGSVNIKNQAALYVNNVNLVSNSVGLNAEKDVTIDNGILLVNNFDTALYLTNINEEETKQTFTSLGNSIITLKGASYGFNSHDYNREINILGGNVEMEGNTGINFANVSVGDAELKVVANNGYTIQASKPVTFKTTSGDYEKGKITLINNTTYNQWYDVNYVLRVIDMHINGGTLKLEGTTKNGIIYTEKDAKLVFENCDVFITSTNDGNGIRAQEGNETITIENTAQIKITGSDIPIGCWNGSSPVKLYIRGNFVVDSYRGTIGEWDDKTIIVEGAINYINHR